MSRSRSQLQVEIHPSYGHDSNQISIRSGCRQVPLASRRSEKQTSAGPFSLFLLTMFESIHSVQRLTCLETVSADIQGPYTVIPGPPAGWVPPIGASSNTWANIYKNKQRMDYCVDQFAYLTNRVKCVEKFTVGPFLA